MDLPTDPRSANKSSEHLAPGQLCLTAEAQGRLIVVHGYGLWTMADMEEHLVEYRSGVNRQRLLCDRVRVLVGLEGMAIQKPEVVDLLTRSTRELYHRGDRVAMIVPSSLAKVQMRRVLDSEYHEYFMSESAARNWLAGGA